MLQRIGRITEPVADPRLAGELEIAGGSIRQNSELWRRGSAHGAVERPRLPEKGAILRLRLPSRYTRFMVDFIGVPIEREFRALR